MGVHVGVGVSLSSLISDLAPIHVQQEIPTASALRKIKSVCVSLSSLISDLAPIHVQQEIPTASALHG